MKKLITLIIITLCLTSAVQAAGLTIWTLTNQIASVDESNSIAGRVGYYFGSDNGGLEIFIGSTWHPRSGVPQVVSGGLVEHLPDLIDPDNPTPWISDVLLAFIDEKAVARPYIGIEGTFNFLEKDVGYYGGMVGIAAKVTPKAMTEWVAEAGLIEPFGDWEGVREFRLKLGIRFPF